MTQERQRFSGLLGKLGLRKPADCRVRADALTDSLNRLTNRLGLSHDDPDAEATKPHPLEFTIERTQKTPRAIFYAPAMDGQVDPGEVVWFWAPSTNDATAHDDPHTERALVVVARQHSDILGLLTSTNTEHKSDEHWIDIGAGPWDESGEQAWARLDKLIRIPESAIRRQGAVIPHRRFERIANRLRKDYGWV